MQGPLIFTLNGKSSLLSGGNSSKRTTDLLAEELGRQGVNAVPLVLPNSLAVHAWSRSFREERASYILDEIKDVTGGVIPSEGVDIACHSMGGLVTHEIMQSVCPHRAFRRIIMFGPALPRSTKWHRLDFDRLVCVHNRADRAIWTGGIIPFHPFGFAGSHGFKTDDERVSNHRDRSGGWFGLNHSHYFDEDHVKGWARFTIDFMAK